MEVPKFTLYGQDDPTIEDNIQPKLAFRGWVKLSEQEKKVALHELVNRGWVKDYSSEILHTVEYLNHNFLRECPGKKLHALKPPDPYARLSGDNYDRKSAAVEDFQNILLNGKSDALIFRMLSRFAAYHIEGHRYQQALNATNDEERGKLIDAAFETFDPLANCLNHIFEQFAVNQVVTRSGFVPRQEDKITAEVYVPTLRVLSDPKWKGVSGDLGKMFQDYQERNYAETITKAHAAVHRFLQVLAGEEGKSGKGEVAKLFQEAKNKGLVPINRFTEPLINVIQAFLASERATNSTAKPSLKEATASDALLMMNVVMVFLQYCLQNPKK
jgi:hypothetical protein